MEKDFEKLLKLFDDLNEELIDFLKKLSVEDWNKETCLKNRSVKDLVSHIVDTSFRRVSMGRDFYFGEKPEDFSHKGMINFIQDLNKKWIEATKRLSPEILIELLKLSNEDMVNHMRGLNPNEKALFSVQWAGEDESTNLFDIEREYTEKWHHQMQIREVFNEELKLYSKKFFDPIVKTFIKGIPYTFDSYEGDNFILEIEIVGLSGKSIFIKKENNKTQFIESVTSENKVIISQEDFWRLVTNSIDKNKIELIKKGDIKLCSHLIEMVAVMS